MKKQSLIHCKKLFIIFSVIFCINRIISAQYPYGNPIIHHMYTADAAPHVMPDGKVWMVTSVDHEKGGGYRTMHKYHTFSTVDMVNWKDHGEIFSIEDLGGETAGKGLALWAPDMIYENGKYYLYFPVRTDTNNKTSYHNGVAVSDSPDKRFKVINEKIDVAPGIDPSVFRDDDGQLYLFVGYHWGGKLKDDMRNFLDKPIQFDAGVSDFMEAIWVHKRNGIYYMNYHTKYDKKINKSNPDDPKRKKSRLDYCTSDKPLGPYKYKGILNYELGVNVKNGPKYPGKNYVVWRVHQSNHGGILEWHGQEYLFYHTSALSSWRKSKFKQPGSWTQRSVCIDLLNYRDDGTIIPVQQTIESVPAVKITQPYEIPLNFSKSIVSAGVIKKGTQYEITENEASIQFENINLGTGYYYFDIKVLNTNADCKLEIRMDKKDGKRVGTVIIKNKFLTTNNDIAVTSLIEARGKHDIYLVSKSDNNIKLTFEKPRFFAGSPYKNTAIHNKASNNKNRHLKLSSTFFKVNNAHLYSLFTVDGKIIGTSNSSSTLKSMSNGVYIATTVINKSKVQRKALLIQ